MLSIRSIEIRDFCSVRAAELEFGPRLNVIFGPNELGKSSIAEAIRAAFLLPPTSTEARAFVPWGTDLVPRVVLEFETPAAEEGTARSNTWRVTKAFGDGRRGTALLERLGGGGTAVEEATGRSVDGRLRELLAWGVRGPGGRSAPRGLPETYLTVALLGRQERVDAVLSTSLAGDGIDSGRARLAEALGTLGRDPIVTRLTDLLEERTRAVYTDRGQLRRTADSPLVRQTSLVREKERRIADLRERVRIGDGIEEEIRLQHQRLDAARELHGRLAAKRDVARARERYECAIASAKSIAAADCELCTLEGELRTHVAQLREADADFERVKTALQSARETLAADSARLDQLSASEEQSREAERSRLRSRRESGEARLNRLLGAVAMRDEVRSREEEVAAARRRRDLAAASLARARRIAAWARTEAELHRARTLLSRQSECEAEQGRRRIGVDEAEVEVHAFEAELESVERSLAREQVSLANAERAGREREIRRETVQARRLRLQGEERALRDDLAVVQSIADLEALVAASERELAERIDEEAAIERDSIEAAAEIEGLAREVHRCRLAAVSVSIVGILAAVLAILFTPVRIVMFATLAACGVSLVPISSKNSR